MRALLVTAAAISALAFAPAAGATPAEDAYLATLQAQGIPIPSNDYLINIAKTVCNTAREYPDMQVVDLVLSDVVSENRPNLYSYDQGKVIVTAALANFCPDAA